jgi:hypothetical protein
MLEETGSSAFEVSDSDSYERKSIISIIKEIE